MLVPVEWLREYTSFDLPVEDLAVKLTMAGLEVEEIHDTPGGQVFSTYVTPNRPDLLSVIGVARDIYALLDTTFKQPAVELVEGDLDINDAVRIDIESPDNCPRYSARLLKGIKVCDSPSWMQERLIAAGMRPINNIVDATNYVLLEMGQPLHAFDYDLIAGRRIIVRQARTGEAMKTIDAEERELNPSMLVIADAERAVAVAGVMGGFESEVSAGTTNVLLESAHFNRLSIRRTARALQMSTEASFRFERGVDPNLTIAALNRVAQLIRMIGGGTIARGIVDVYPKPIEPLTIAIRPKRASMMLGFDVTAEQTTGDLTRLGMGVDAGDPELIEATVPTFRPDITREEDLIEEVGRIYGYDRIPTRLPSGRTTQGRDSAQGIFTSRVTNLLVSAGLQEIVTGSMVPQMGNENQVVLRTPLSDDLSRLRNRLLLDVLSVISYNAGRGVRETGLFEIGHVFRPQPDGAITEQLYIAGAIVGSMWGSTWNVDRNCLEADFYVCKGIVQNVLDRLGVEDVTYTPAALEWFHPTRAATIEAGGSPIGVIGEVNPDVAKSWDLPGRTYAFELDYDKLMLLAGSARTRAAISRYPAVTRDLAVVVAGDVPYNRVKELLTEGGGDLLESLALFDVYTGPPLQDGQKSMAFSVTFRSKERTLRDEEVDGRLSRMREMLAAGLGASFRET